MKISDLDYLNPLSEAPSPVGGTAVGGNFYPYSSGEKTLRRSQESGYGIDEETLRQLQALGYEIDYVSINKVTDSGAEVNSISATGYFSDGGAFAYSSSSVSNISSNV